MIHDDLTDTWSSDLALLGPVPFLSHQVTVPTQDRIRRDTRGQLSQCFAT